MQNDTSLELISVSRIRRSKNINPRKGRNKSKFAKLVESIRNNGLLQPILVRPIQGEECEFEVVAGDSRFCAVNEIGVETIAAQVREMSEQDARVYAALENMDRSDLTVIEEAQHAVVLLCDMANDHEAVMKALSLAVNNFSDF